MVSSPTFTQSSDKDPRRLLRHLPAVGAVVEAVRGLSDRAASADGDLLTYLARRLVASERQRILASKGSEVPEVLGVEAMAQRLLERLAEWDGGSSTRRVLNGTGIVLHSGLGRAVLPAVAADAVGRAKGYVLLEVDQEEGRRRKRDAFLEELLCHLTGAEAALVVNNNAAATILALAGLASGREVVVSRSQMVEIGGSFRMPEVMEASGCVLREVGATNRSYPRDYEAAIGEQTGALMLVHTSNYRLVGFTEHVGIEAMVDIGRRHDVPVIHDLGSGCLLPELAGEGETVVTDSVRTGADVICFSGDKLLGGTQAGILVGKRESIQLLRRHPLARAFRIDKLTCIGLEATLKLYLEPSRLHTEIPALAMLSAKPEDLEARARELASQLEERLGERAVVGLEPSTSEMGAGSLPAVGLPTTCVTVSSPQRAAHLLARDLRLSPLPLFTRVREGAVWVDPRTLLEGELGEVVEAFVGVLL